MRHQLHLAVCALQFYNNQHPSISGAAILGIKTAQTIALLLNPSLSSGLIN